MTAANDMSEAKEPVTFATTVEGEKIKLSDTNSSEQLPASLKETGREFNVTESDLLEAKHLAATFTLDKTIAVSRKSHAHSPVHAVACTDRVLSDDEKGAQATRQRPQFPHRDHQPH